MAAKSPEANICSSAVFLLGGYILKGFGFGVENNGENEMTTGGERIERIISLSLQSALSSHRKMAS